MNKTNGQDVLTSLPLAELVAHCQAQTLAYLRTRELGDDRYCLELFRRAVQDDDQRAWAFVYTFYSTEEFLGDHYLLKWVRSWLHGRHGALIRAFHTEEEMVQEVWLRFMRSDAARNFSFTDMRHLMAYLRRLVNNYAMDLARRKAPDIVEHDGAGEENYFEEVLRSIPDESQGMERMITSQEDIDRLLREIVGAIVTTERESLVFRGYFLDELPPRKLYELYPGIFARGEVETIRTRLVRRLRRTPYLLTRYIHLVILRDDERSRLVFDYSLVAGWPDSQVLLRYPSYFADRADLLAAKVHVLEALSSRPELLRFLEMV
jgi:RNA polymerase sigma factor (sigma-70 family)